MVPKFSSVPPKKQRVAEFQLKVNPHLRSGDGKDTAVILASVIRHPQYKEKKISHMAPFLFMSNIPFLKGASTFTFYIL